MNELGELRPSQLIYTFGVGAIMDLPNMSALILGLDDWDTLQCQEIIEERLLAAVQQRMGPQVRQLMLPPVTFDYDNEPQAVLERIERLLRREVAEVEEEILPEDEGEERAAPITPPAQSIQVALTARRFEFTGGNSRKFWAVSQDGVSLHIRFGRIGTTGQVQVKTFADEARAAREMVKLIAEKTGRGYSEVV
jgi:predicted DNA-binding WGR domain protein